ncbi:RNA 2'-phosphotransferase [Pseudomonas syringae]|uniref:RNA 2'-phosphotransferase n=1 Tax=Pseudomonas syringae TaxID=317 RepID=UPI003F75369F
MSKQKLDELSKFLSYVLRHEPEAIGLELSRDGWADIDMLIACAAKNEQVFDRDFLERVVAESEKKRFLISEDRRYIRAAQGHSNSSVSIQYTQVVPPEFLYHGTATRFLESIFKEGLVAGARHYVHLSESKETARSVGLRYGKPIVLEIEALHMHDLGFKFFKAENNVWLIDKVPASWLVLKD